MDRRRTSCKVSVETSSINGQATVLVNGQPVEPGEREVDGSHVNYQRRTESGTGGGCSYSSVRVSSTGGEPTNVNVQQGSGCDASDHQDRFGSFASSFGRSTGFGAQAAWEDDDDWDSDDDDEDPLEDAFELLRRVRGERRPRHNHGRDVKDRRFYDVQNMMDDLRREMGSSGDGANGRNDNSGTRTNADSSSGTGAAGERRNAHIDGNGYHASARTSGTGPHHESVHTSTRRMPGGGISRTVRASATSTG